MLDTKSKKMRRLKVLLITLTVLLPAVLLVALYPRMGQVYEQKVQEIEREAQESTFELEEAVETEDYLPAEEIIISMESSPEEVPADDVVNRGLSVYGKKGGIYIESTLEEETNVLIYNVAGQIIKEVSVPPMGKMFVPVTSRGIYIVNKQKVTVM